VAIAIIIIIVILIKIITDGNLTLTERLIKKIYCIYIISAKKERMRLGGSKWVQKKTRFQKREARAHGSATKKIETYCYSEIFFP
jgi:hypothetical protein